jgi:hypothetical protein
VRYIYWKIRYHRHCPGMKFISQLAFVLTVFMVISSSDTIPDPPAVSPHSLEVQVSWLPHLIGDFREQLFTGASDCQSSHAPLHSLTPVGAPEPKRSSDWITSTGYAANSSPPVL